MAKKNKDKEKNLKEDKNIDTQAVEEQVAEKQEDNEQNVVSELEKELGKEKDKFLRLFAEFENYKKRTSKERVELFKTASQDVMVSLLPILDDFDRALKELSKSEDKEMFTGVEIISNKFRDTLKSKGLSEMEVAEAATFDAEEHEAITQIPAPDKSLKGKVIDVIEKGYRLGDKIIRHPKVVVGQ
ncbi:MAG: nucleotide exchange factor GrpE [Flavobacteriaceae bacterium]|nr:nucleotide exchange factor GrpE [Flavobacteriaceae bacterium]